MVWVSALIFVISLYFGFLVALLTISVTFTNISSGFYNFGSTIPMGIGMLTTYLLYELLGIPIITTFPLSAISGGVFSVILYLLVIKPVMKNAKSHVLTSLASLGLVLVFKYSLTVIGYYLNVHLPSDLWCGSGYTSSRFYVNHFHFRISPFGLDIISLLIVLMFSMVLVFMGIWRMGFNDFYKYRIKTLRENPELLFAQGVNVNKVRIITWFVSGCLSGLAGCLLPVIFGGYPGMRNEEMVMIVALSSLLAGLFSFSWAIVIGFTMGVNEIFTTNFMQSVFGAEMGEYRQIYTIILWLILVVFFRKIELWDEPDFEYT